MRRYHDRPGARSEKGEEDALAVACPPAREALWDLITVSRVLNAHPVGTIITAWNGDDLERVREGIEAVDRLKAALDAPANVVPFPTA